MEKTIERTVGTEFTDDDDLEPVGEDTVGTAGEQQAHREDEGAMVYLSSDHLGRTVVDAEGEDIKTVTEIDETGDVLFVDSLHGFRIERATDDEVRLKPREQLNR